MRIIHPKSFKAGRPWGAIDIANMDGITTRLHWTDKPYHWHTNDGEEVFIVVHGEVNMHYKEQGEVQIANLQTGSIFHAVAGTEHVAHPVGEARIVVIEKEGSE